MIIHVEDGKWKVHDFSTWKTGRARVLGGTERIEDKVETVEVNKDKGVFSILLSHRGVGTRAVFRYIMAKWKQGKRANPDEISELRTARQKRLNIFL